LPTAADIDWHKSRKLQSATTLSKYFPKPKQYCDRMNMETIKLLID